MKGQTVVHQEFSEEGRRARFEQWEKYGADRLKSDLQTDPYRRVGSKPVQDLAWEFVRMKEQGSEADQHNIQKDSWELLKTIEHATRGSATPVAVEQLGDLQMTVDEIKAAFQYLKEKGLIQANFAIFYAARLRAAGHDAIQQAEMAGARQPQPATPAREEKSSELLTLKPGMWGMSIDLKEAGRRIRRRLQLREGKG
jgi:hypothetical protein